MATQQSLTFLSDINLTHEVKDLISTLPTDMSYDAKIYNFKGFWSFPHELDAILSCRKHFQAHNTDIFLATFPKSGTVWLKALIFSLTNRNNYKVTEKSHPLLMKNPHDLVPFLELELYINQQIPNLDDWSSPRLFATHMPFTILPTSIADSSSKIVYLCRNPKDNFISHWHHMSKAVPQSKVSMEEAFQQYCKGSSAFGPFWEHILCYWKTSLENPDKVLFLTYEEMKKQPHIQVCKLADFLGCPINEKEQTSNLVDDILELCCFEKLSSLKVNKSPGWLFGFNNDLYFRKGEVGDWQNYLTTEMANQLDEICKEKFAESGFRF